MSPYEYHEETGMADFRDDLEQQARDEYAEWEHDTQDERDEAYADAYAAQYDDDPNPYHGDYSEM